MGEGGGPLAVSTPRLLIWRGLDQWRTEAAEIHLTADGLAARGTQIGLDPLPYRLNYRLEAPERFVTRSLEIEVSGDGWRRELHLTHDGEGSWQCHGTKSGRAQKDLPASGGDTAGLQDSLDCDLGLSPLTNLMPIRRHGLHQGLGEAEFVMAWISVPDLALHVSAQHYEHLRMKPEGAVVRFTDEGMFKGFTSELELDEDGLVRVYPELAARVGPGHVGGSSRH
jgi:uncharacterized protein